MSWPPSWAPSPCHNAEALAEATDTEVTEALTEDTDTEDTMVADTEDSIVDNNAANLIAIIVPDSKKSSILTVWPFVQLIKNLRANYVYGLLFLVK